MSLLLSLLALLGLAATGAQDIAFEFTARVETIEILPGRVVPDGAVRVHVDPRFGLRLRVLRVVQGTARPERLLYAIHSPAKLFRRPASAAQGRVFRFVERPVRDAGGRVIGRRLTVRAPRPFDAGPGWRGLRWGMSDTQVRKVLDRMGVAYEVDERTGYFPAPLGAPGTPGGTQPGFVEAHFTHFSFRTGRARVHAELLGWQLRRVTITSRPMSTPAEVEDKLTALQKALGKPDKTYPASEVSGALRLHYHNAESSLSVNVANLKDGWVVTETYQREPQPNWR